MRSIVIAALIIVFAAAHPLAQQAKDDDTVARVRKANHKILIGLTLIGAGAFTGPLTAAARRDGDMGGTAMTAGMGMMFVGSGIAWWGLHERTRALQPQTAIGVDLGRTVGVRVRRTW